MAILIRPGKRFRKARAGNGAEILKKLEDYLKSASTEPVELLCGFWKDQSNAITYQELRQAVLDGELDEKTADEWMQDYSLLVPGKAQRYVAKCNRSRFHQSADNPGS